ncbi:hypothetical protein FHS89_000821 [Rubricella aquisinus]|uniref:Yip1 domain-containing protein n=1 Tax=Rubricella aquisinus TaxID=2028108 RepID=A0A840WYR2_9RHOB|nr:YIP1 family protein [Rubricella aquisinus]MBB5514815.1 hypothetical protein [Rubricella aquisinus]
MLLSQLIHYTRTSLMDARDATRQAMRAPFATSEVVWIGITCVILTVLISQTVLELRFGLSEVVLEQSDTPAFVALTLQNPLLLAVFYVGIYVLSLFGAVRVGALFGGKATPHEAIAAVTMTVVVGLAVNTVESILLLTITPFASLFALAAAVWLFYLFAVAIAEAHGFENLAAVMGGIIATAFAALVLTTLIAALFGLAA